MDFSRAINVKDGVATICILGDIDLADTEHLLGVGSIALGEAFTHTLVIDCSGIGFCGSTALNVFVVWNNLAAREGTKLRFSGAPPGLRRLFRITDLDDVFDIEPSR